VSLNPNTVEMLRKAAQWVLRPIIAPVDITGRPSKTLCGRCQLITADALASDHGFDHVPRLDDLADTWLNCSLCYILRVARLRGETNLRLKLGPPPPRGKAGNFGITAICGSSTGEVAQVVPQLFVAVPIGDPGAAYGIPVANRQLTDTRSQETFQFIRECINDCARLHRCNLSRADLFGQHGLRDPYHPARLIDVCAFRLGDNPKTDHVRLATIEGLCPQYMTLSHCWGNGLLDEQMTLLRNYDFRKKAILVDSLTKIFKDAIEITRTLGVRYLWIDSLCIIQDCDEDKAAEIAKMGDIYTNSFLTIAASLKGDSSGGCFNKKSITHDCIPSPRKELQSIEITTRGQTGARSTLILLHQLESSAPLPLKNSPLSGRGWVYQERVLSPRTIHFTPTQAVWECREMYRTEDLLSNPTGIIESTMSGLIVSRKTQNIDPVQHWYKKIICTDYSYRAFSKPQDRLVALAGLAEVWQYEVNDAYLAGHWGSSLAFGLAWLRDQRLHNREADSKGHNCRNPTW